VAISDALPLEAALLSSRSRL